MDSICWSSIMRDTKLGELAPAGISTAVRSDLGDSWISMLASMTCRSIMELLDELIRVDVSCQTRNVCCDVVREWWFETCQLKVSKLESRGDWIFKALPFD
jgi:hypothetical protein